MRTILFAPTVFNLAETVRMIGVTKAMKDRYYCVFFGFSKTFAPLITEGGFEYHLLTPILTRKQEEQIIKFDQLRTLKNPFTKEMVASRIADEQSLIAKFKPRLIVTGSSVTIFLSARDKKAPLVYVKPYILSESFLRSEYALMPHELHFFGPLNDPLWHWTKKRIVNTRRIPNAFKHAAQKEMFPLLKTSL